MPLTVCFYEDKTWRRFVPLTLLRPVYTLRPGIVPLFKKMERHFSVESTCLVSRNQVAQFLAETFREYPVNIIKRGESDVLFLNGRTHSYGDLPDLAQQARISTVFMNGDEVVAVLFKADLLKDFPAVATQREFQELYDRELANAPCANTTATLYGYCWDIVADIEPEIAADFQYLRDSFPLPQNVKVHDGVFLINQDDVFLGYGVEILPGAVVDASRGPVYLGANVRIESHSAIIGPCFVGPNSIVLAGKITCSSIGHTSRVGGEVEASVFHAYVNKYHAGFIGHSYVGQWVNFGAMTTNSDIKNNYSNIRVSLNGESIDSCSLKVGSFIGDHTKFGIGTLLNTGINIGVCCNIFGGSLVADKEVPSFSWGKPEQYRRYDFEKALETARKVADRRNFQLPTGEIRILQAICNDALTDDGLMCFDRG